VQPTETPFGRKTTIDQASCNLDASCLRGDCPSFLTVTPRRRRRPARRGAPIVEVPNVEVTVADPDVDPTVTDWTIRLSGIGGTGVVTVSQVLGTAAMLDGFHVRGLDQTGLSQKAGPVVSDLRLSRDQPRSSNMATTGSVDALLAFDALVAASDVHVAGCSSERTQVVASVSAVPTGAMVTHPSTPYPGDAAFERLRARSRSLHGIDAIAATTAALGDPATANVYLLGVAVQRGAVPVHPASVERAIELNGVAVAANLAAFRLGRNAAAPDTQGSGAARTGDDDDEPLAAVIARRRDDLVGYQNARYARRYVEAVERVRVLGDDRLTRTVAEQLHHLMAYKDEYEVARLLLLPSSRAAAEAVGGPGARVQWNLHPPMLRALGLQHKIRLGRSARPLLVGLRAAKRLRGTPFDLFGHASLRRLERSLRDDYVRALDLIVDGWRPERARAALVIARIPEPVRGYEDVKRPRAQAASTELARRTAAWAAGDDTLND
jgi:indolepyruvate ferredoxin oxidoreductase